MVKNTGIIMFLIFMLAFQAHAGEARDIVQRVLDRDDGTTEVGRIKLSTCPVEKKGKKIVCSAKPRVKMMDMIRKDYGPDEKDHKTVTIIQEPPAFTTPPVLTVSRPSQKLLFPTLLSRSDVRTPPFSTTSSPDSSTPN